MNNNDFSFPDVFEVVDFAGSNAGGFPVTSRTAAQSLPNPDRPVASSLLPDGTKIVSYENGEISE